MNKLRSLLLAVASSCCIVALGQKTIAEQQYWLDGQANQRQSLAASIDVSSLNPGMHSFSVRVKDTEGLWSAPITRYFIIPSLVPNSTEIAERQYWLDGDYASRSALGTSETAIDLGELGPGMHSFTMRVRTDCDVWSAPVTQYFFIPVVTSDEEAILTHYLYWFDNDNAQAQSGLLQESSGIIPVSIKHLSEGQHALKWAVGNSLGKWSPVAVDSFLVTHIPLSEGMIALEARSFEYRAAEIEPEPTVTDGSETLVCDEDYEVVYADNRNAGEATITVIGKGFYKDSVLTSCTITKAPLTVKADDKAREQGEENPELTFTIEGWKGEDDESVLSALPTATTEAAPDSPVGTYEIFVNGGEAQNYSFRYVSGWLTVEESVGVRKIRAAEEEDGWYTIDGLKLSGRPTRAGLYIHNGRKVSVK